MKIRFIIILMILGMLPMVNAAWWNTSFTNCTEINITNNVNLALTNYVIYVNLTNPCGCSDYSCVRFVNDTCNGASTAIQLNSTHWSYGTGWDYEAVRINSIPALGKVNISFYCVNTTPVSSVSFGAGTYPLLYDNTSINNSASYTRVTGATCIMNYNTTTKNLQFGTSCLQTFFNTSGSVYPMIPIDSVVEADYYVTQTASTGYDGIGFLKNYTTTGNYILDTVFGGTNRRFILKNMSNLQVSNDSLYAYTAPKWFHFIVVYNSSVNGAQNGTETKNIGTSRWLFNTFRENQLPFGVVGDAKDQFTNITARPFVRPEPTATLGTTYTYSAGGDTCDCTSLQAGTAINCAENCAIGTCDTGGKNITFTGTGTITTTGDVTGFFTAIFSSTHSCPVIIGPGKKFG